jgi:hypothetical protein
MNLPGSRLMEVQRTCPLRSTSYSLNRGDFDLFNLLPEGVLDLLLLDQSPEFVGPE